jgi:hypothetical protein
LFLRSSRGVARRFQVSCPRVQDVMSRTQSASSSACCAGG